MTKITLFAQIIQQLPKDLIKSLIKKHGTDKHWLTRSFVGTSLQAMKSYKSVNRLWERTTRQA
ncbi:hypothetical protein [Prevotella sp. oral taxon 820]|uniref:hypothetical protein n=1 Tax=Prevotella sp. oral taxon 820 TaxID=2081962 RepID=UPI000D1D6687|nr:hypothetical protein [Prevotella sp. oral taxon 820]